MLKQNAPNEPASELLGGNAPVTREDAAKTVQSLFHLSDAPSSFSDVPSSSPYAGAVGAVAKAGIMNGVGNGRFGYGVVLSQAEAAALNARVAHYARLASISADTVEGLSIEQIESGLRSGAFTCQQLISAYTARIEAYDQQGPMLNAIINMNENAKAEAAELDKKQRSGAALGAAHCVPVVVKDVINTDDMPTTNGSELFKNWIPDSNATVINRLEEQGAIVLAKTNLDDFAAAVYGISSLKSAMKNPYDLTRTVGGSSGGSAAAIAAQYAPLAIGTDTGGSLRIPAALTGVVTIRPTMGLVSAHGIFPRALTQDTAGPLAATVKDAATGLDFIAGYDPADPVTARSVGKIPAEGYASFAKGGRLDGVKIGLVTGGLAIWGDQPKGPVVALLRKAAEDIEALGGEVVEIAGPPKSLLGGSSVITFESARDVNKFLAEQGGNVPVTTFRGLYDSGKYSPYAKESYDREIKIDPDALNNNVDYQRSLAMRTALQDWTLDTMAKNGFAAIAYPSSAQLADLIGKEQAGLFSRWSENTGFPAISVPMGYAKSKTGTYMPANIEFLGRAFDEPAIIHIASAYENSTKKRVEPALPEIATLATP
ncbi:amidase [Paenibacillus beijingensis]|uniref:amidase n=1 Tax=Paenibacillus beijingensis TaxID=1126833 RepID=UPI00130ECC04|nr:amidase family protein [Paenibacillus beijingensis]